MATGALPPLPQFGDATAIPLSWSLFDVDKQVWTDIPQRAIAVNAVEAGNPSPTAKRPISLVTWNIDAFAHEHVARLGRLLEAIYRQCSRAAPTDTAPRDDSDTPDVIFLQEVSGLAKRALLENAWICGNYYVSDRDWFLGDYSSPFYNITLVSRHRFEVNDLGAVWRIDFPSRYGRYALCCDLVQPATAECSRARVYRYANVHLDSLAARPNKRPRQLQIVAEVLRGEGVAGGLVAGDFNPVIPEEDDGTVEANGLLDCWKVLQPGQDGFTWVPKARETYPPRRMDKIAVTTDRRDGKDSKDSKYGKDAADRTSDSLRPRSIEVLRPGTVTQGTGSGDAAGELQARAPSLQVAWSDHCGLYATFSLS